MNLLKRLLIGCIFSCLFLVNFSSVALGDVILPDLNGAELLRKIAIEYAPEKTLGYRTGRDVLYTNIDNKNGVVTGIYTGYTAQIDPDSSSPRNDATRQHINAEHVYPQSKGANGYAKSDLHNLFPAFDRVNSARGNNPMGEIEDSLTKKWFRDNQELRTIPTQLIDEYSESLTNQLFEPRESKKGDVARAMFYFYTVYQPQAQRKDPDFFSKQVQNLCQWNRLDPIEEGEKERSHLIAGYQGNENPFVIDSNLASRTYCQ